MTKGVAGDAILTPGGLFTNLEIKDLEGSVQFYVDSRAGIETIQDGPQNIALNFSAKFDINAGTSEFFQIKVVVDESRVVFDSNDESEEKTYKNEAGEEVDFQLDPLGGISIRFAPTSPLYS